MSDPLKIVKYTGHLKEDSERDVLDALTLAFWTAFFTCLAVFPYRALPAPLAAALICQDIDSILMLNDLRHAFS